MSTDTKHSAPVSAEPVAWVRRHPDGALTAEFLEHATIEPARKNSGAWVPLYTAPVAAQARPEIDGVTLDGCLETLFRIGEHLGIDYAQARKSPEAPSSVYIKAIEDRVAAQPDVTQQTLDDVKAGIPARDAEIDSLRKEIETLRACAVPAETLRICGVIADKIEDGSLFMAGIYRNKDLAEFVRQVLSSVSITQAQQPVSGSDGLPTERVLIDGTAYELPSAVAAELLRLHLEILEAEQAQAQPLARQDADKVDAERYRWLRERSNHATPVQVARYFGPCYHSGTRIYGADIDAAIDAARKENP